MACECPSDHEESESTEHVRDEFVKQMNWDKIQSKRSLIDELKCGVTKIQLEVVLVGVIVCQQLMAIIYMK